ncbi:MAG TPA: FecR domain-containing protein [Accumulibacter sp.]|uniref:FecR domain-containing protein n=1 Tax=Accumulibacter sp. TaxID=2053492 RepID=UPI00262DFA2A|nr:FecR domain-containing protein [Accumulibacter sp.]HNN46985.1 FecR domain-containing protein [Azospira sp.]MDS4056701.1 FecR domain-containing protein [Accumulibacter sp.]HMV06887.1 FecR domain-containing protein [Accumulibacter sp.]HMW64921.1 FecR domain-containing protein [Accumulibacter sp.]HMW79245.1 FecR domain-containing protein [Accumulibacter sp.]
MLQISRHKRASGLAASALCAAAFCAAPLMAAEPTPAAATGWDAQVKVSRGVVNIERDGQRYPGVVGARLKEKDTIQTGGNGSVGIMFKDNSTLSLGSDAEVVLQRYAYDSTTYMGAFDAYIKRGTVSVQAGNIAKQTPEAMRMVTPKAEVSGTAKNYVVSVGE